MKFKELWLKVSGNNRMSWWNIDDHNETGMIRPEANLHEIPERILMGTVVRVSADGKNMIDVGLSDL